MMVMMMVMLMPLLPLFLQLHTKRIHPYFRACARVLACMPRADDKADVFHLNDNIYFNVRRGVQTRAERASTHENPKMLGCIYG